MNLVPHGKLDLPSTFYISSERREGGGVVLNCYKGDTKGVDRYGMGESPGNLTRIRSSRKLEEALQVRLDVGLLPRCGRGRA